MYRFKRIDFFYKLYKISQHNIANIFTRFLISNGCSPIKHVEREEALHFLPEFPVVIYQTEKIISDDSAAARRVFDWVRVEDEERNEEESYLFSFLNIMDYIF